jgi:hypothetical protein
MFDKGCKFELTDDQYNIIAEWEKTHKCTLLSKFGIEKYYGPIGGAISITFIPTSIGIIVYARCACGSSLYVAADF